MGLTTMVSQIPEIHIKYCFPRTGSEDTSLFHQQTRCKPATRNNECCTWSRRTEKQGT